MEWLTGLFNVIFRTSSMPEEWRWSTMIPLYKNKGDINNCSNYRGIKLLATLRKFGRGWWRLGSIGRRSAKSQEGFFGDVMRLKGVLVTYIRVNEDMYDEAKTWARIGSAFSTFFFTLVIDEDELLWHMLFADDIVLMDETRDEVNDQLEFSLSKTETEYLECKFNNVTHEADVEVRMGTQVISGRGSFKIMVRSIRLLHIVLEWWMKWMFASGVLCDKNVSPRLKGGSGPYGGQDKEGETEIVKHVKRRCSYTPVTPIRRCERLDMMSLKEGRGRSKKYWGKVIRQDMAHLQLTEDIEVED
ncbi:hypothetical protein H5410_043201 [Solanum commersonii]|uniref:Reverse transcriptase domain-containing protein n=1 Tax=Solanum commersonii TaxID=4109 RepID=A0A9J5XYJ4_SOLCO|nr:hypothetical protein H5410_043201 [Solanum commersonii]